MHGRLGRNACACVCYSRGLEQEQLLQAVVALHPQGRASVARPSRSSPPPALRSVILGAYSVRFPGECVWSGGSGGVQVLQGRADLLGALAPATRLNQGWPLLTRSRSRCSATPSTGCRRRAMGLRRHAAPERAASRAAFSASLASLIPPRCTETGTKSWTTSADFAGMRARAARHRSALPMTWPEASEPDQLTLAAWQERRHARAGRGGSVRKTSAAAHTVCGSRPAWLAADHADASWLRLSPAEAASWSRPTAAVSASCP